MGPKRGASTQRGEDKRPPPSTQQVGILVQDLFLDEDYDRYIEKFQSKKDVSPQFYCSLWNIESMGFDFHKFLTFLNFGSFVELKKGYDESEIKAFYCNAQTQDSVSFECAFKNVRVSLNPEKWDCLVHLGYSGVDIEAKDT